MAEHGHDASVPTFWIWEGVVPYLPEQATRPDSGMICRCCRTSCTQ
ncbi:MAG: class I SAM-dependent methyltransferase [Proteobacteria bacterium]|nr:class I SAM-dependent methyltransferase [Pseudomonadota bacterium]